jgi:hypothetical protein
MLQLSFKTTGMDCTSPTRYWFSIRLTSLSTAWVLKVYPTRGLASRNPDMVRKIVEQEIDSLPVVKYHLDADGEEKPQVVGKITKTNIARLFLDLATRSNEGG